MFENCYNSKDKPYLACMTAAQNKFPRIDCARVKERLAAVDSPLFCIRVIPKPCCEV